ncbi:MAG: NAD(P)H-dependent oxidoreductase subunit E, partial [Thermoleophilia bacterium]|nr:NAD(P)H-dependent oxidoreductase subunit E [Thermoleophilia bacterium]
MVAAELERLREEVVAIAKQNGFSRASLIPILREIKAKHHGIDSDAVQVVADVLGVSPAGVHAVSTFYAFIKPQQQGQYAFRLCRTYSCELKGKEEVAKQLQSELGLRFGETSADGAFTLEWANCMGMCDQGPAMLVNDEIHTRLTPEKITQIVQDYRGRRAGAAPVHGLAVDADFANAANELTFSTIPVGEGLAKALTLRRFEIIDLIRDSRLKGRGGAGFPTGVKWNFAAAETRTPKYIICNADEGEPGTFKDRLILSEYADLVMEGMTIGGRAVGSPVGLIYLRAEYGYLRAHLEEVIRKRT